MNKERDDIERLTAAFNAELTDEKRNHVVGASGDDRPRFELYHAGFSVCSQKVRAVLAEKKIPYLSHELSILNSRGIYSDKLTPAENYSPNYVHLRLLGGRARGLDLASGYSGRSAVETEGFDACVVPTLVDHARGQVIVDSKVICEYLDAEGTPRLIPEDPALKQAVLEQLAIVDVTPQPALLYGAHPDDDQRPEFIKKAMATSYDLKLEALETLLEANREDPELQAAYSCKIAKEKAAREMLADGSKVVALRQEAQAIIHALDEQLAASANPWVCGDQFTLADLAWAINLYRMQWLGVASLWRDLPRVEHYARRLYKRPSIWSAVIKFPSPMPESPHTADIEIPEWAA
ncbi:glutathione S-transferase family protein [Pseudohaliea rubra]|uniref:Maleylacetoacetate isomerase/ Glutathione S-transferase n=1 Tax=Pseudohaliea rubra DSM 19751 TaxID=1265313 RepID=A0A095VT95_9GAMM|nr:glutathione S-transferase family protein [Pseudohaliea rubra]KGE04570.1 Maleylacetoacetate isomerase/ Glutathione S-transferase [Pseudohaliea rubra DSM 19751]